MSSPKGQELTARLGITSPADYKVHCAVWNGDVHPLDAFIQNPAERKAWNEYQTARDDFNRKYIVLLAKYYTKPDTWLYYGTFRVKKRIPGKTGGVSYRVEEVDDDEGLIGRVKIRAVVKSRQRRLLYGEFAKKVTGMEVLSDPYNGPDFPGAEDINMTFGTLRAKYQSHDREWEKALSKIGGVYVITDVKHNKRYVGVAANIWHRWAMYAETGGTGHNKGLKEFLTDMENQQSRISYALHYLRFSILESWKVEAKDRHESRARESHWKRVMLSSKNQFGYNHN
ncbi:MAG: hypothetical protein MPK75_10185 [Alphaproteobacteria bacterium]|nr:hypothetical protein [Alphaproteobacteria bacterium]